MPTLPSGARLWLSMEAILAPGRLFHPCPPGRFWYRDLDPLAGWTIDDEAAPVERWRTGIVPKTRLDAAAFVRVLVAGPRDAERVWRGDWLLTLEQPGILDEADWKATLAFLGTDRVLGFLDLARERCRRQAEERGVHADLGDHGPPLAGRVDTRSRLLNGLQATRRLGEDLMQAEAVGDVLREHRIRIALGSLAAAAEAIGDAGSLDASLARHVAAEAVNRLGELEGAVDWIEGGDVPVVIDPDDEAAIEMVFADDLDRRLARRGLVGFG